MNTLRLGELAIDTVLESPRLRMPFAHFLPASTTAEIERERSWLTPRLASFPGDAHHEPAGELPGAVAFLSFHSYLVRAPGVTILIDTCIGNDKDRGGHPAFHRLSTDWLGQLAARGVAPEQIDYVFCTHMHADHVGWNTRLENGRWVPTFPRARYVFARREYELREASWRRAREDRSVAAAGYGAFEDSVLPVVESRQAQIVESDHEFAPYLRLEPAPGHTPGNVVIRAASQGEKAVFSGDVVHHPVQIVHPEWSAAFCEDPVQSAETRRRFVSEQAETGDLVLAAHFPTPTAGRVTARGERFEWSFVGE